MDRRQPRLASLLLGRLWLAAALLSLAGCTGLFFQPYRGHLLTPERVGVAFEDVHFRSSDGLTLHGWFLPAQGAARGTVLFLHGNAENISTHLGSVYWLPKHGYNVFLFDYRGYGDSEGKPSLPGVIDDTESALRALRHRSDIDQRRIILFGQSLGGAVATYVAAHSPQRQYIQALIIDSTFSSYRRIAREALSGWWVTWPFQWPLAFTIDDSYSPLKAIPQVSPIPLLVIHSEKDPVIGVHHAQKLHAAAREPKTLWLLPDGAHIQTFTKEENRARFVRYLDGVLAGK